MNTPKLDRVFEQLKETRIDLTAYDASAEEVAFELTTFDTFIAGAATTVLSGCAPSPEVEHVLERPLPLRGTIWSTQSDREVDLADVPELLNYARIIEAVRKSCLAHVRN